MYAMHFTHTLGVLAYRPRRPIVEMMHIANVWQLSCGAEYRLGISVLICFGATEYKLHLWPFFECKIDILHQFSRKAADHVLTIIVLSVLLPQ